MTANMERILIEVDLEENPRAKYDGHVIHLMFPDSTEFSTFIREDAATDDGFWALRRVEWCRDKEAEIIWYELGERYYINPRYVMYYKLYEVRWATREELKRMIHEGEGDEE